MDGRLKKVLGNGAFLLFCMGVTAYFVLQGQDFPALMGYIQDSSQTYWIGGFVLVIAFILCESLILFYLLRAFGESPKALHCCLYSFVGFFFSLVTPTASGGQPMQLIFMRHDKLNTSRCVIALLLVTITYKSVLVLIGLIIALFQPASIMALLDPAMGWVWLGIFLNVLCVGGMLALVFAPSLTRRIVLFGLSLAKKPLGAQRAAAWEERAEAAMLKYREASTYVKKHARVVVNVMGITIVQRCLLFAVTYVVLLSFGINVLSLAETILLQGSISLSADMLPLPGGLGISEHLYNLIFAPVCGDALTTPTLIISRGLSFYAQLLTSALLTVVAYFVVFRTKRGVN